MMPQPIVKAKRANPFAFLKFIPFLFFVGVALIAAAIFAPGPLIEPKTVVIPHGAGPHEVAKLLDDAGAIYQPDVFRWTSKFLADNNLKAGEYQFFANQNMYSILGMIHEGRSVVHLFTVAEGLSSREVMDLLKDVQILTGDVAVPAEGSLMPESYRYMYGDTRASVVERMQKSMKDALNDAWAKRDPNLNMISTPEEAVVMASVVEKETGKAAERPRIAGVFYNRLRNHMRLQSDPTVIYAIEQAKGAMDRGLEHDDLAFLSPYNTYVSDGLPPHPICNPGKAAIEAALHPEWHDLLYFVADGTGGHAFARTLAEHNQNVARWSEIQSKK